MTRGHWRGGDAQVWLHRFRGKLPGVSSEAPSSRQFCNVARVWRPCLKMQPLAITCWPARVVSFSRSNSKFDIFLGLILDSFHSLIISVEVLGCATRRIRRNGDNFLDASKLPPARLVGLPGGLRHVLNHATRLLGSQLKVTLSLWDTLAVGSWFKAYCQCAGE